MKTVGVGANTWLLALTIRRLHLYPDTLVPS